MPLRSVNRLRRSSSRVNDSPAQWFPCGPLLASHLTWFFPGLFLLRSRPWILTTAAEGGLEPAPASRFRGANPHRSSSYTHWALLGPLRSWRTVVRIPREPETSPLQLPVELVKHDITEQGRQRSALRRPLIHRTHQPAFHHSGLQKRPDQLQQSPIADPGFDSGHQFVVRNPVKEFLEIQVYAPAIAVGDILLCLCHRLMSRAPGSKPVAVVGKRPVPLALQHLHHRLLDESVQHRWDAKLSHPSVRLADFHPPPRLRRKAPAQPLFPHGRPMLV